MTTLQFNRPKDEPFNKSCIEIGKKLKERGMRPSRIYTQGLTDTDGSQIYHAVVKGGPGPA